MDKMYRGDKLYLDKEQKKESCINRYLECRDGIINVFEYETICYQKERLFYCEDSKHDSICIVRHTYSDTEKEWIEECIDFSSDDFKFLKALVTGEPSQYNCEPYFTIRDFTEND